MNLRPTQLCIHIVIFLHYTIGLFEHTLSFPTKSRSLNFPLFLYYRYFIVLQPFTTSFHIFLYPNQPPNWSIIRNRFQKQKDPMQIIFNLFIQSQSLIINSFHLLIIQVSHIRILLLLICLFFKISLIINKMEKQDFTKELIETAKKICTPGKGILAADQSPGSVEKKFKALNLENTAENRRRYRDMLLTTEGIQQYISGVIFHQETAKQTTLDGVNFISLLQSKGIVPGIKVDKGLGVINANGENYTKGLDALPAMAKQFYNLGCRFAKWRAVLKISNGCPSQQALLENAWGLARYAAICQQNGLVPIVEPQILSDGDHSAEQSQKVTQRVLSVVFSALQKNNILLQGCLLKPNMVTYGSQHPNKKQNNSVEEAHRTVRALSRTVPAALPGITFLSGGQTQQQASMHLNHMNRVSDIKRPWFLSFSFGRALQNSSIKAWGGLDENKKAGQEALLVRAKANSQAQLGKYAGSNDQAANQSLFEASYSY